MRGVTVILAFAFCIGCGPSYEIEDGEVRYGIEEVPDADPGSFENLGAGYGMDNTGVYFRTSRLPEADPDSFEVVSRFYARDDHHVWIAGVVVPGADPETFERIGYRFYRDKHDVYFDGDPLEACDPSTFEIVDVDTSLYGSLASWQRDSQCIYYRRGKKVPVADPESFVPLELNYARDKQNVYYGDQIVSGADPQTFQVGGPFGKWSGFDASGCYYTETAVSCAEAEKAKREFKVPTPLELQ